VARGAGTRSGLGPRSRNSYTVIYSCAVHAASTSTAPVATLRFGALELECRPQRAKDVMKAMFVAMRFGLG
jgi:hypothetical protein